MEITTPEKLKKPRDRVKITAKTLPGTLVAVLAADESLTFIGTDNLISYSNLVDQFLILYWF